jgi:hypothetical protein
MLDGLPATASFGFFVGAMAMGLALARLLDGFSGNPQSASGTPRTAPHASQLAGSMPPPNEVLFDDAAIGWILLVRHTDPLLRLQER